MKNVYEQMEEQNARENVAAFLQKQALPYEAKKTAAKQRVLEYYHEMCDVRNANVHVSVGGLDSITLFIFIRDYCHLDVPGYPRAFSRTNRCRRYISSLVLRT